MKSITFLMPPVAVVGCTLLLLYSCRKDVDKPCCNDDPIRPKWLLTSVLTQSFRGAGHWDIGMHRFEYNANNQLIVYKEMDYIDPAFPPTRIDSFYYDDQNRIVEIRNAGYKKMFVYGSGDRKRYNCKYLIDSRGTYYLSDSTVYIYQGETISKITYHVAGNTSDTAIFTYDNVGNLIKVKLGELDPTFHDLERYDNKVNPSRYFGVASIEIEPSNLRVGWESDFWIMMQSPVFSKNNYHLRRNVGSYEYDVAYSALDTTVSGISYYMQDIDAEVFVNFEYRVGH